jgi:hypothetical protein
VEETITLAGREFSIVGQDVSAAQDDYLMGHLRLAGAIEVLADIDEKRTPEKKSEALLTKLLISGRKQFVVAGLLTEVGKKWTRESAERNAATFAEITEHDEKRAMYQTLVALTLIFFKLGERSSATSPTFSSQSGKVPDTSKEGPGTSETSA